MGKAQELHFVGLVDALSFTSGRSADAFLALVFVVGGTVVVGVVVGRKSMRGPRCRHRRWRLVREVEVAKVR